MKIVLLLGPSSAGKSTLCGALVREHGWYTHGADQVGEVLQKERTAALLERLQERGLFQRLSPYMSESEITTLAATGQLNLTYRSVSIKHQFENPEFHELKTVLAQAGLPEQDLEALTHLIHEVGDVFKTLPMTDGLERMIDDVFKLPSDASVIIDQVPPNEGDVNQMINDFREKITQHAAIDGREIEFATVLAFCPPKALSERIHHRNTSAELSGDLVNKREGMFPFLQLSQLISTVKADGEIDHARTLSKMQLLLIALRHLPPEVGKDEAKKAKAIFRAGAHEYRELMKRFRFSDETSNVSISHREDLGAHAVIDLSSDTSPSDLAIELIAKITDIPRLSI